MRGIKQLMQLFFFLTRFMFYVKLIGKVELVGSISSSHKITGGSCVLSDNG